jgi:uncharacterized protein (DUF924 family)
LFPAVAGVIIKSINRNLSERQKLFFLHPFTHNDHFSLQNLFNKFLEINPPCLTSGSPDNVQEWKNFREVMQTYGKFPGHENFQTTVWKKWGELRVALELQAVSTADGTQQKSIANSQ